MQAAWQRQILGIHQSRHPWDKVAGPCSATFLAFKQLGWNCSSAFLWRTDEGHPIDVRTAAPLSVRELARDAAL
eukprot:8627175-Pyramimonas_sp.AAC.1